MADFKRQNTGALLIEIISGFILFSIIAKKIDEFRERTRRETTINMATFARPLLQETYPQRTYPQNNPIYHIIN